MVLQISAFGYTVIVKQAPICLHIFLNFLPDSKILFWLLLSSSTLELERLSSAIPINFSFLWKNMWNFINLVIAIAIAVNVRCVSLSNTSDDFWWHALYSVDSFPVQTIFEAGDQGVVAMALTPDARYLVTISAGAPQVLCIWDWTVEGDAALCSATLDPSYGVQNFVLFNPDDTTQIVSNSESQVIFYAWVCWKLFWNCYNFSSLISACIVITWGNEVVFEDLLRSSCISAPPIFLWRLKIGLS